MSARNPVGWFEIYVTDIARARAFYEAVLGVTMASLLNPEGGGTGMWAFPMAPDVPGAAGALVSTQGSQRPTGNGTLVYFTCEDCAVEAARVPGQGGTIVKEKFPIGEYGFVALVADLDGNVIGLHSRA